MSLLHQEEHQTEMQLPPHFEYGDDDDQSTETIAIRRLYLAVFTQAVHDICTGKPVYKTQALEWFQGLAPNARITFKQVCDIFNFKASRMKKIAEAKFIRPVRSKVKKG